MKKLIVVIMSILLLLSACGRKNTFTAEMYYVNSVSGEMTAEKREVEYNKDVAVLAKNITEELLKGPKNTELRSVITKGTSVLSVELEGTVAYVSVSDEFDKGENIDKLLSRYTLINTLCSVEGINKVKILVEGNEIMSLADGTPLGALGKEDIVSLLSSESDTSDIAVLYFWNNDTTACEKENRVITVKEGNTVEKAIVEAVIGGPKNETLKATVSKDVKVIDVKIQDGVCFVNLSEDFVTKNTGGTTRETGAIYSIVNSLCELKDINKVQFLIEGEKREEFGQFVFNEPFEPSFKW